ncbi:MAG: phospholipase D-like domain-containing protein [Elusimicrobiota bacterium]|nr:MAG: phospholipase D-like domain-containing protein [Elusimicrobiota bacterium]
MPAALAPAAPAASKALPASAIPAAVPAALSPVKAAASKPEDGEPELPKNALDQLKGEDGRAAAPQDAPVEQAPSSSNRFFDGARSVMSAVSSVLAGLTEGAFHPLGRVKTPPPAETGDDGGGPTSSRAVEFNGQTFPSVAFRPNEPVETQLVKAIESSRESIKIALYEFTSRGILKALLAAKTRGVKVEVILCDTSVNPRNEPDADYERYRSEQIWALIRRGVDVTVLGSPSKYGINHHKFAVFDGKMANFGSYNWTYTSEASHYENVIFTAEADRVAAYEAAWAHMRALSVSVAESENKQWTLDIPPPPSDLARGISFNGVALPKWVFNPGELFEDSIVEAIDASKVSVDVAAFVITSRKIIDAMERAVKRGVPVRLVADQSQTKHEHVQLFLGWIQRRGIQVRILGGPHGEDSDFPLAEKMHNKYFIFDGKLVETGSGNASKNAGVSNFENANFLDDATDVAAFVKTFQHMFDIAATAPAYPEGEIPTDAQMRETALQPRGPPPPAKPGPGALPAARRIAFNGVEFPVSAIRPNEPVERELVKQIDSAAKTLHIAMYELNQQGIWDALQRAKKRGVKIEIVLDRSHVYTTGYDDDGTPRKPKQMIVDLIKDGGFDIVILKGRLGGIMHNKFIIADETLASFGSYNFTQQSEDDHWENMFFSTDRKRVAGYQRYFEYMRSHPLAEEPDHEKLDELLARTEAWTEAQDKAWDKAHGRTGALADDEGLEPEMAGRAKKPLPPNPPQETETPISFNGESYPLQAFSPNAGIEQALVRAIDASKATIEIAMFSFFSQPIAEALLRAKERDVKVRVVMDKSQTAQSKIDDWFAWHGIELRLLRGPDDRRDPRYQKMHNKFGLFDGKLLASGSFNYSSRAEALSFENINYFDEADEIARFALSFEQMFSRGKAPKAPRREPKFVVPASEQPGS